MIQRMKHSKSAYKSDNQEINEVGFCKLNILIDSLTNTI